MPISGGGGIASISVVLDAATLAWVAAVISNGGTVSNGRQTIVNNLIVGLKADGIWTKLDRLWLLGAENQPSALTDIVGRILATAVNSPSFTTDRGFTGVDSSTTIYIDTNTNFSSLGGQLSATSAHISGWSVTDVQAGAGGGELVGAGTDAGGANASGIQNRYSDGNAYFRIVDGISSGGTAVTDATGHYLANRSTGANSQGYKNGSLLATIDQTGGSLANTTATILAAHNTAAGITFGNGNQCAMASYGGSLSSTEVANLYNRLRTYMTAVGVP